ncbi:MAG: Holliday junction resolvase RuvX [Pseudomonadota bacterium]
MGPPAWLTDPRAFQQAVGTKGPLLGLDPGTRTIGVAISDVDWTLASALETIRRTKLVQDAHTLASIIDREGVCGLVIGLPLNMDGSSGPRAQSVRGFRRSLSEHIALPMLLWDERLSSASAGDKLREGGASRQARERLLDAAAAAEILTDAMRALRALNR